MWRETPSSAVVAAQKSTGAATIATSQRIASDDPGRVVGGDDAEHRRLDVLCRRAPSRGRPGRRRPAPPSARSPPSPRRPSGTAKAPSETIRFRSRGRDVDVRRQVRGGLDPGVGEHRDHRRVDDVVEVGAVKRSIWSVRRSGWKTASTPTTITASCRAMSARARTASEALAAAPGDVEDVEHAGGDDHHAGDGDLPAPARQRSEEIGSR